MSTFPQRQESHAQPQRRKACASKFFLRPFAPPPLCGRFRVLLRLGVIIVLFSVPAWAQQNMATHTRGKLWETLFNWGFIGHPGAWDYNQRTGIGFYPGFSGFTYPRREEDANSELIIDPNFHNFRTGPWIIAKDAMTPVPPDYHFEPKDFVIYHSSLATGEEGVLSNIAPWVKTSNFNGAPDFNPLLPEEMNYSWFHTVTGITVKQRSMAWSYPGYHDFIIYDFVFTNTGDIAVPAINKTVHLDQTLNEVWIVFHSGIQVSTKGWINFHWNQSSFLESAAPAGGFGWHPKHGYNDYYAVENRTADGKGTLYYSRDYNGGREPAPNDTYVKRPNWQQLLTKPGASLPELQDPACFGFVFLYRTPPPGANPDPFDADPNFFNVYSDEMHKFRGKTVDFEGFGLSTFSRNEIYEYARHDFLPPTNGNLYCWYTSSFGPYKLAPGDSVRLIVAEVAGVMDLKQVYLGDPNHWYPDSSIAAIRRNAEAARRAARWGLGAKVNGIDLAADVPEAPPAPNCRAANVSTGSDTALIAVQWDKLAEETEITDGSGAVFFDGATEVSGYRIYRGNDKRGIWDLLADIPRAEFDQYWRPDLNRYEYIDRDLQFGFEFYYYVQAYNSNPKPWTSANGARVERLGELASDDNNRTALIGARPGPINLEEKGWDVFVAPNPYVEGDPNRSFGEPTPRKIEFRNLPERATIKIFSVSGDLIKTLKHGPDELGNLFGSIAWDQRSNSGLLVAPGLYIYVVQSDTPDSLGGTKAKGKLMIIR